MYSKQMKRKIEEKEYPVEEILSKRLTNKGKLEYYLKWKDFPKSENSWEPVENLNCPGLIEAYETSLKGEYSDKKRKQKSDKNAATYSVQKKKATMYSKLKKGKVGEKIYPVEKILKKRLTYEGKLEFYLKWKDFPNSENSWEPAENLSPALIKAYEASSKGERSGKKMKLKWNKNDATYSVRKKKATAENSDGATCSITSLPDEILLKIFTYLTQKDLGRVAQLCRRFNECTKSPELWKKVNVRFRWSRGSVNEVTEIFTEKLPNSCTHLLLDFSFPFHWKDRLHFEEFCMNLQKRCPRLQSLQLHSTKISVGLLPAIDICSHFFPNLSVLSFYDSLFGDYPVEEVYRGVSKIEVLDLIFCHCRIKDFKNNFFSKMPRLKKLYLGLINPDVFLLRDTSLLSRLEVLYMDKVENGYRIFKSLEKFALNMTELYLCSASNICDGDLSFNIRGFQRLKIICLRYTAVTCTGVIILIKSCPSLQTVFVDARLADDYAAHPFVATHKSTVSIVKGNEECYDHGFGKFE